MDNVIYNPMVGDEIETHKATECSDQTIIPAGAKGIVMKESGPTGHFVKFSDGSEVVIANGNMKFISSEKQREFSELRKAAEPLLKYLCENHHPHVTAIVTGTSIELLEGLMNIPKIHDFIVD